MNRMTCLLLAALAFTAIQVEPAQAQSQTRLRNICRVKGQEENTLQGLGLVVGLNGTGDGGNFVPAIRSLATAMQLMGSPLSRPNGRAGGLAELRDVKNVALVLVTATVPAGGGRQGTKIDCQVASIGSAKSLEGGRLFLTPLQGPQVGNPRVFAFAEGLLHVDDINSPTTARIHSGCQLEEDLFHGFTQDGRITLVLEKNQAGFHVAQEVADLINTQLGIYSEDSVLARAVDQSNIIVAIPTQYQTDPVGFVAQVLNLQMVVPQVEARVVINERTGSVVIGGEVTVGSVAITHRNLVVETGRYAGFVPLGYGEETTSLKSLVEALNAVKLPTEDIIEIIKGLDRNGKLHGKLIIE